MTDLCHCGRPLKHTGRHLGFKVTAPSAVVTKRGADGKLRGMIEHEIKICHETIARVKGEIRTRQGDLLTAEAKLAPLRALLDVYVAPRALPAPAQESRISAAPEEKSPDVSDIRVKRGWPPVVAHEAGPDLDEADFEPIDAEFSQVVRWATVRGIPFKSWEDLPKINARREEFELPPFKRRLRA